MYIGILYNIENVNKLKFNNSSVHSNTNNKKSTIDSS